MNIDIFEKQQSAQGYGDGNSSSHDDVANLKHKIEKKKSKQRRLKVVLFTLVGLVIVLASLFAYSQYKLYTLSQEEKIVQGTALQQENATSTPKTPEEIVAALKRHILVPSGDPQIAEVQDVATLKEKQAFFKDAQNGDLVIVYETMIYVYRPSDDVVVAASDISGAGQVNP